MSGFSFSSLVLSGVQAAAGVKVLDPGQYVCDVTVAEIIDTKAQGGKRMKVGLKDTQGKGVITDFINIFLPGKEEATRIGMEQLKALLVHGGHPDPDNIGEHGVASIKGLKVGVIVGNGKDLDGNKRPEVKGYCDPTTVKGYEQSVTTNGAPAIGGAAAAGGKLPF